MFHGGGQLAFLIEEAVLSYGLGGPEVMAEQFDESLVRVELLAARVTVTAPGEISQYAAAFNRLAAMAVHGRHARRLVESALDELDT